MGLIKDKRFWAGVIVGTVFGQIVLGKVAPSAKAKLPG